MATVSDIIERWPSAEHFAADIGAKYPSYGRVLKMRGRIPRKYWPDALAAASRREIDLKEADLESAHAATAPAPSPEEMRT